MKDLFATILEDITAEKDAEEEAGDKAEEEAEKRVTPQDDVNWQEADFSFEDAPPTAVKGNPHLCPWTQESHRSC